MPTLLGFVRWAELRRRTRKIFSALAIDVDVDRAVNSLPAGARQLVEIAKALSLESRILLLDEPTSALTAEEVEALLRFIKQLKASGIGIVYVSHKLSEVFQIADQITVLRDGRRVSTRPASLTSGEAVVRDMVGHHLAAFAEAPREPGGVALHRRGHKRCRGALRHGGCASEPSGRGSRCRRRAARGCRRGCGRARRGVLP